MRFGRYQIFQSLYEHDVLGKNKKARRKAPSCLEYTKKISNILLGKYKFEHIPWDEISEELSWGLVEYLQSKHKKVVIFVPSELVQWLSGCTFDVRDEEVRLPLNMEMVTFAFEDSNDAYPSLIAQLTINQFDELLKEVSLPLPPFARGRYDSCFTVLVNHELFGELAIGGVNSGSGGVLLEGFANVRAPERFRDSDMVQKTVQMTVKLCIYLSAFPDALQPGAPQEVAENEPKSFKTIQRPKCFHLSAPKLDMEGEVRPHMRRGHFRSLRSTRYHRDENGNVRIVYVRPTFIHGEVDPYTAT